MFYQKSKDEGQYMKERTGIILSGGTAERFGCDKGLLELGGKPLILHVFDGVKDLVDEVIIVVGSNEQKRAYSKIFPPEINIQTDIRKENSPLIGALTGFANAEGKYCVLLPCDTPFISKEIIELLFEASHNVDAVIPRWPNGYIEPLQAVYHTSSAFSATEKVVLKGERRMKAMISLLHPVRYLSTIVLKDVNPGLLTFFNVNTPVDLRRAEILFKKKARLKRS